MTPRTPAVVVVDLAGRVLDPHTPVLRADDPMIARGDGVFETLLVRDGRACLLNAHLARLAASAATVGLPPLDDARWRAAIATALTQWSGGEAVLRLLYGRGGEGHRRRWSPCRRCRNVSRRLGATAWPP